MEEQTVTQEKKVLFTVDACYPEDRYTKTMFVRTIRLPMKICKFMIPVILAELLALTILDRKRTAVWSGILLLIAFFYVLIVFIMPLKAKKNTAQSMLRAKTAFSIPTMRTASESSRRPSKRC